MLTSETSSRTLRASFGAVLTLVTNALRYSVTFAAAPTRPKMDAATDIPSIIGTSAWNLENPSKESFKVLPLSLAGTEAHRERRELRSDKTPHSLTLNTLVNG